MLLDVAAQRRQRRRIADGDDDGLDDLTPLVVVDAAHHHLRHTGMVGQCGLDGFGPDVLAAGDDQVTAPSLDVQSSVVEPSPQVAGGEPAVGVDGCGAVAVAPQQHRTAQPDLTAIVDLHLDAIEGHTVVDHAAAGLRHAVGRDAVGRSVDRWAAPAEHDRAEPFGPDPWERGGDQRHQCGVRRVDGIGVEAGQHGEPGAGVQRPSHDRQAADVRQREARQPVVVRGHTQPCGGRRRGGGDRVVGEHDTFRFTGRSAGRDHQRIARLDGITHPHRCAHGRPGGRREALVDRERCVAAVPDPPELVDEPDTAGSVDGDQAAGRRHDVIGSIGVIAPTSASISAAILSTRRSVNRSPIT